MPEERPDKEPVIIIGGGPTGLSLALGLARQGVRSIIFEKKEKLSEHSRAPVIHQRTREILDQWGIGGEFLASGNLVENLNIRSTKKEKKLLSLDFGELNGEAERPGILILKQSETERILLRAVERTGMCKVHFSSEVVELDQNGGAVNIKVKQQGIEKQFHAEYCIGCDGASSFVRDFLNLDFPGKTYPVRTVLADVKITDQRNELRWPRFYNGKGEITVGIKIDTALWRIIHLESGKKQKDEQEKEISASELSLWVEQVLGKGGFEEIWTSPFKIHRRSSPRFRKGRFILAGDAAHIHSPVGGQGMNAGIQDAHNLSWKIAAVLKGGKENQLLDSYERERKEVVVEKVSGNTDFVTRTFLQSPLFLRAISFFVLRRFLSISFFRRQFLRRVTMINLGYSSGSGAFISTSRSAGKRLPNVILESYDGKEVRLYKLLSWEIVILSFQKGSLPVTNVKVVKFGQEGYEDPTGRLSALLHNRPGWIIVRPDMHIAWAGENVEEMQAAIMLMRGES